ncbi:MAG: hypothetical protein CFE26_01165 [Verrucomicrobiales bacterium VVV1]|nr:MAG: hypothetical protein CFE26_01165 [Verrucomicrobiales bacterium VVV1]
MGSRQTPPVGLHLQPVMVRKSARTPSFSPVRRLGWLIALVLMAGLPSCTVAPKPISFEGRMISSVVIRHSLAEFATHDWDQRLLGYMKLKKGILYSNELADHDIRSLYESGYVDDVRFRVEEDGQSIRVFVEVEERPPFGPSPFTGNTAFSDQELARVTRSSLKRPLTEDMIEIHRKKLEQFYRQQGYKQVRITINYERWGKRSVQDFVFVIEEGPRTPPWYERLFQSPGKATAP